ncbi:MAG: amidohydrolase family protein [archaeon]|nr:amidohydrolase family protein [archaeon]
MITVIHNAWIVTQNANRDILKGDVVIENDSIVSVGGEYNSSADKEIDAKGDIVMPGLINTHTHVAMAPLKGICDDLPFDKFLNVTSEIDKKRDTYDIEMGAKLGCMEMMRGGTTTFVDLYYSEDVIAKAVQEAGIRGVLCWCCLDEELTTQRGNPLNNCKNFCRTYKNHRKIIPGVGLQGVYVCGEETCLGAKEFSEENNLPLNLHLSETRTEVNNHKKTTGLRPVEWLNKIDALSSNMIAAHSAWLTINEVRLMGKAGMSVSLCAVSNMKLATGGIAPVPELISNGVNVTVGTDSNSTNNSLDMFSEMKIAGLLHKFARWDTTVTPAQQLLDFCTINGAKSIGMNNKIGSIETGKYADIIIIDGHTPNIRPLTPNNIVTNLVYSTSSLNVKTVFCQGDLLVEQGNILTLNGENIMDKSENIWNKLSVS